MTMLRHRYQLEEFWINEKVFQSFSKEHKKILIDSANDAGDFFSPKGRAMEDKLIERMIMEQGVSILHINPEPWQEKILPYIQKLVDDGYILKEVWEARQAALK